MSDETKRGAADSTQTASRRRVLRLLCLTPLAALAIALAPGAPFADASEAPHMAVAFSAETPEAVTQAAAAGITTDILYGGPPRPGSTLATALANAHISVIDARLSGVLFDWECHRTHTVVPPPPGERNGYCRKDEDPAMNSSGAVLSAIRGYVEEDAANPLVRGYWILDDWVWWDGGSGRELLQEVRAEIEEITPGYPAICGFGGAIMPVGQPGGFDPATAENFSPAGCSIVGLYNYTEPSGRKRIEKEEFEWSMPALLAEETEELAANGWVETQTPILGIDQAWSGHFAGRYEPGLSVPEMLTEAEGFCNAGASSIGWYAWADSGFRRRTLTPADSSEIREGIQQAIEACGF